MFFYGGGVRVRGLAGWEPLDHALFPCGRWKQTFLLQMIVSVQAVSTRRDIKSWMLIRDLEESIFNLKQHLLNAEADDSDADDGKQWWLQKNLNIKMCNNVGLTQTCPEKRVYTIPGITSSNVGPFSKFFRYHNLLEICNKAMPPHLSRIVRW